MKICLFYQSIVSDWNHGNAHFLRGMVTSLLNDGHDVTVFEPLHGWSFTNLLADAGIRPICEYKRRFENHKVKFYDENEFNPAILKDADLVIVHEWNKPEIINTIGNYRKENESFILLFHDTHHRILSDFENMSKNDLSGYDGVLAFGQVIKNMYVEKQWAKKAWTWHEAADNTIFKPISTPAQYEGDLVWIGNWGDDERTQEIIDYIIEPVKELGLKAKFYGVRYPNHALEKLCEANIEYGGWLPNYMVPEVFSKYRLTVHVPRKPYVEKLRGIPTIRPFEALACGIPLISAPWDDSENLFRVNEDFIMVKKPGEMKEVIAEVLRNSELREKLAVNGLETIWQRHTCDHRKKELYEIIDEMKILEKPLQELSYML